MACVSVLNRIQAEYAISLIAKTKSMPISTVVIDHLQMQLM